MRKGKITKLNKPIGRGDNLDSRLVFRLCQIVNRVKNPQSEYDPFINRVKSSQPVY